MNIRLEYIASQTQREKTTPLVPTNQNELATNEVHKLYPTTTTLFMGRRPPSNSGAAF